jgi:hypothetical protein
MKSNLEYLNNDLKYLGFGENTLLNQQLLDNVAQGKPEFELFTDAFFEHFVRTEAKLHFMKLIKQGTYVFDRYTATNQYEQDPGKNKGREFHIYKGTGVTLKEAYNLLDGRAARIDQINADDEKYRVWVQLDFDEKDAHRNYRYKYYRHYDLEKILAGYPIEEFQAEPTRKMLLSSLERGNRHLVTLNTGKLEPKWIEANPAEKSIRITAPTPAKKRSSEERRSSKRASRAASDLAGEKMTEDQEMPEEAISSTGN